MKVGFETTPLVFEEKALPTKEALIPREITQFQGKSEEERFKHRVATIYSFLFTYLSNQ